MPSKRPDRLGRIGGYWLSQRPNSAAWYRTWFDRRTRQTRRASLGTTDLQEAELKLAEWVVKSAGMREEQSEEVALEAILLRYYHQHAITLRSVVQARYALGRWSDFFPEAVLSEVTPTRIRAFALAMRKEGLSNGYIRRVLAVGKAALSWAQREGEVSDVPHIDLSIAPETEPRDRPITHEEAVQLFDAAEKAHHWLYLLLAFGTAAKHEAILQLTASQVDMDKRLIRLNPPGRPQTKKRRPTIPTCETLAPYLRGFKPGPVNHYKGQPLKSVRMAFRYLTTRTRTPSRGGGPTRPSPASHGTPRRGLVAYPECQGTGRRAA